MSSLQNILSIGRASLFAHQSALAAASNNTANAGVEGFAKRDVLFTSRGLDGGVGIESIRRRADRWIEQRMLFEGSRLGTHQAQQQGLSSIELQLHAGNGGLGPLIDAFFGAVSNLGSDPADVQARVALLSAAQSVSEAFNVAASRIELERSQADGALTGAVDQVNSLAREIGAINGVIERAEAAGGDANAERDRRDVLLGRLAEHLPIDVVVSSGGALSVIIDGGQPLVQSSHASQLRATPDPALGGMHRIELVDASGLLTDVTGSLRQGKVGGLLALRDGSLSAIAARLDTLAHDLATAFNGVHAGGFGLDGVGGRNFFAPPAGVAGAAASLALAPALADNPGWIAAASDAATAVGGNGNALALARLSEDDLAGGGTRTFAEEFASIIADVGRRSADVEHGIEQAELQLAQVQAIREAQTGVSLDEELIDITRFQRAYQAAAKVISIVDELYETVLSL
jgi:flagellar hook-associated protein 1 FlgK